MWNIVFIERTIELENNMLQTLLNLRLSERLELKDFVEHEESNQQSIKNLSEISKTFAVLHDATNDESGKVKDSKDDTENDTDIQGVPDKKRLAYFM